VSTVLHILSQRPDSTGSGVTLAALVSGARRARWAQHVICGVHAGSGHPELAGLHSPQIHPLYFGSPPLDFALPGMSDVMPYPSTRFRDMTPEQIATYRSAWRDHLAEVIGATGPDLIHSHHLWLLSALIKDVAPDIPVVTHCHATGLRQMTLCPELAPAVVAGCRRNERFCALHEADARRIAKVLDISQDRISVVGAGIRAEIFHSRGRTQRTGPALAYAGKYSHAKGLPWLLDAVERLAPEFPGLTLHVAGTGTGTEADRLAKRMRAMAPTVELHGQVSQGQLAEILRRSAVFVLPSLYEGLPLVLVEALACGCRLVCSDLAGVRENLAPHLGEVLELVPLPRLLGADRPVEDDLPRFTANLHDALRRALEAPPPPDPAERVRLFTWDRVFDRVATSWDAARRR
jgi:glycosyltransferase involved in cell wall biosynthesis